MVRDKLEPIIGEDRYQVLASTVKVIERMTTPSVPGISGRVPSLSLDSILSRGYNLNRNVVSPQYTFLELVLRQNRESGGRALQAMLNNPQLARRVLDELEAGNMLPEKSYPDIIRALTIESIRQEANNAYRRETYKNVIVPFVEDKRTVEPPPQFDEFSSLTQEDIEGPMTPGEDTSKLKKTGIKTIDQLRALGFQL